MKNLVSWTAEEEIQEKQKAQGKSHGHKKNQVTDVHQAVVEGFPGKFCRRGQSMSIQITVNEKAAGSGSKKKHGQDKAGENQEKLWQKRAFHKLFTSNL